MIPTDLAISVPDGTYGRIGNPTFRLSPHVSLFEAPRSSLAKNNFIDVGAGVIDADYRGNVGIILFNHSEIDFKGQSDKSSRVFIASQLKKAIGWLS
jgi:dUTP pyrophosphatase